MKIISIKPLITISPEEKRAIEIVATLLDSINESELDASNTLSGDELNDMFFGNRDFNCKVADEPN